jgi:undecaprenyl diphosphate synthase
MEFTRPNNTDEEKVWLERARSTSIPKHIAIVMDGNGRWALSQGLKRTEGHRAGIDTIRRCLPAFMNLGIPYVTLFAFSTENWNRPKTEVDFLMSLIVEWAQKDRSSLIRDGVRLIPIGRWKELPLACSQAISKIAEDTKSGRNLTVLLAVNYGGRADILDACKKIVSLASKNKLSVKSLTEDMFEKYLYTAGYPDPDLILRTSGEKRVSNFLLWQGAYSELVFTDVYWPDFTAVDLYKAVVEYGTRKRRFGGVTTRG